VRGRSALGVGVIAAGFATSAVALLAHHLIVRFGGPNVMGWFFLHVAPLGAMGVGAVAAIGYCIALSNSQRRVTRTAFLLLFFLQVGVYFAGQYVEFLRLQLVYADTGKPVGFFRYFHEVTMSTSWETKAGPERMGDLAYLYRLLEIVGFAGAGTFAVRMFVVEKPSCATCNTFTSIRRLAALPASPPYPEEGIQSLSDDEREAFREEQDRMIGDATEAARLLCEIAAGGKADEFEDALTSLEDGKADALDLPCRLEIEIQSCGPCGTGKLRTSLVSDDDIGVRTGMIARTELPQDVVFALHASGRAK
jgi:hypothetical protein